MEGEEFEVGSIKYEGKAVPPGVLGAAQAGEALSGLDELIKFFNQKQALDTKEIHYEIPVRIKEGSWEAAIVFGLGSFATAYLGVAGKKMGEKDFEDVGFKDIFGKSLDAARNLIRLGKHTKKFGGWQFESVEWRSDNEEVGVPNEQGDIEYFPAEYLKWYSSIPQKSVQKILGVVEQDRQLLITIKDSQGNKKQDVVTIKEKPIFFPEPQKELDEQEVLFPDLEHGDIVALEGRLTRGNAETNSLGLEYKEHILNCVPSYGSIIKYKPYLFLKCKVRGEVTRLHGKEKVLEKKPTIIIYEVELLEGGAQEDLFS